jgi:uncharacterized protein (TIGR02453 family)
MNLLSIVDFLKELNVNNNREWFAENKNRYTDLKIYFEDICKDLILKIAEFDDDIKNVDVKDCVFRIYKDVRFSHDKTPYKTHFGVYIASAGGRKSQRGGYYLHIDPAGSFVAVGVWFPPSNILKALRQSVYDNIEELQEIINKDDFKNNFGNFYEEDKLKKIPTGFPKDFEYAELLKLKHYMVDYKLDNETLGSNNFTQRIAAIVKKGYPLNKFLNYTVDELI